MSERDAAVVREVMALIVEAERGVRELYPRLYDEMEAEGGAACLTTRRLREAVARGEAAGDGVLAEKDAEIERLREALAKVEAIHHPSQTEYGPDYCRTCSDACGDWVQWPCPTGAALASVPAVDAGDRAPASEVFRAPTSFYEQTPSEVQP
jgi:hypothetical protein